MHRVSYIYVHTGGEVVMIHTPETWVMKDWNHPNNIDVMTNEGRVIAEILCPPMPESCKVSGDRSECVANARLITCAPELLEVTKMVAENYIINEHTLIRCRFCLGFGDVVEGIVHAKWCPVPRAKEVMVRINGR